MTRRIHGCRVCRVGLPPAAGTLRRSLRPRFRRVLQAARTLRLRQASTTKSAESWRTCWPTSWTSKSKSFSARTGPVSMICSMSTRRSSWLRSGSLRPGLAFRRLALRETLIAFSRYLRSEIALVVRVIAAEWTCFALSFVVSEFGRRGHLWPPWSARHRHLQRGLQMP